MISHVPNNLLLNDRKIALKMTLEVQNDGIIYDFNEHSIYMIMSKLRGIAEILNYSEKTKFPKKKKFIKNMTFKKRKIFRRKSGGKNFPGKFTKTANDGKACLLLQMHFN